MSEHDRIDAALLRELQQLAAISLSPEEASALREKLERVVGFLSEIDAVEIPEPEPWEPDPRLREDEPVPPLDHRRVMENAPRWRDRFFEVPPVLPASTLSDENEEKDS